MPEEKGETILFDIRAELIVEEQKRRTAEHLRKQALLRESRAARAAQGKRASLVRRGGHWLGVQMVRAGTRLQQPGRGASPRTLHGAAR